MPPDATPTEPINPNPAVAQATSPAAPAAAAPAATPAATSPQTESEDNNVLNTILGLIKPEDKKVAPPTEPKKEPSAEPAKEPAKPAEPAPQKTVKVKKREPAPSPITEDKVADTVRRVIEETNQRAAQTPALKQEPVKPAEPEFPADVTAEERDELELYKFIEAKDPSKKGLLQKGLKFLEENKKFLEKRVQEEGGDYDPSTDPQYQKFLDANEPKLSSFEKRRFTIQRETDGLKQEAYEQVKKELLPQIQKNERKLLEYELNPKIQSRIDAFRSEVAEVMPEEVVKVWRENNHDFTKVKEQFPIEFDAISSSSMGAIHVAQEFLRLRNGLSNLQENNSQHQYIQHFIDEQARVFAEKGGNSRIKDGKQFIHPYQFKRGMEEQYWTFEDDDILAMLKVQAGREAKARIAIEYQRLELAAEARKRRLAAQNGAVASAQTQEPVSPAIPSSPSPGAAAPVAVEDKNILNTLLGFGTK